ncbi:MAG: hypothetical protein HY744_10620 [Deltaproteobacteria bacterium]|nr:hypothetical protein [Deltaproteobacteria bacterium]
MRDQPLQYAADPSDETRPGHPGRCPQVAAPDPLELPSEKELRQELLTKVVGDLRSKVLAGYDAYRQRFLAEARRSEAAGLNEEAVESYVRYVLTGTHDLKEQGQIRAFLSKAKGLGQFEALWSHSPSRPRSRGRGDAPEGRVGTPTPSRRDGLTSSARLLTYRSTFRAGPLGALALAAA